MSKDPTKLGMPIIGPAERDAIHVAIVPVTSDEVLYAAQHVGLVKGTLDKVTPSVAPHIGIVDPFWKGPVYPGSRFYMVLFQGSITSLRHDWTHPAFETAPVVPVKRERKAKAKIEPEIVLPIVDAGASPNWIRDFASSVGLSSVILMDGAASYLHCGDYLCFGGLLAGKDVPDEFWNHYEIVTGTIVAPENRGTFFTCSC